MAKPKFDYDGNDFYDEILALAMQGGDINEFQLVWDGTNYRAYHLNRRWS